MQTQRKQTHTRKSERNNLLCVCVSLCETGAWKSQLFPGGFLPSLITTGLIQAGGDGQNRDVYACNGLCGEKAQSHRRDPALMVEVKIFPCFSDLAVELALTPLERASINEAGMGNSALNKKKRKTQWASSHTFKNSQSICLLIYPSVYLSINPSILLGGICSTELLMFWGNCPFNFSLKTGKQINC